MKPSEYTQSIGMDTWSSTSGDWSGETQWLTDNTQRLTGVGVSLTKSTHISKLQISAWVGPSYEVCVAARCIRRGSGHRGREAPGLGPAARVARTRAEAVTWATQAAARLA